MKKLILFFALISSPNIFAACTGSPTCTVGSGKSYSTIAACAAAAVAGDTCDVYAGTYAGWTQGASGSAGLPITFSKHTGEAVTINSTVTLSSRQYITATGFTMTAGFVGNATQQHCIINSIHFNLNSGTVAWTITDGIGSTGSDNVFSNNIITVTGQSAGGANVYVFGDRNRFENNEISGGGADAFEVGGANVVLRGNYFHDVNGSTSGEHIDFVQLLGGNGAPTLSFSLIENNVEKNCINQCHFIQLRSIGAQGVADTIIARYNYVYNIDSAFASYGNHNDGAATVPNGFVYNNTVPLLTTGTDIGNCVEYDSGFGSTFNNICYSTEPNGTSPIYASQGGAENGNIAFNPGYSGSWGAPYSGEGTYTTLRNRDPQFANYPTDGTLLSTSPARSAGVAPTTVAASDPHNGTSLIVNDAHGFQPGWAGTQPDQIRIGPTNTVAIVSINYSTNTITLASGVSRASGDPVYLYSYSTGTPVLFSAAPDVGAYPYSAGGTVATPTDAPGQGTYTSTQNVTLACATGTAAVCYTTDGATPGASTPGTCDSDGHTQTYTVAFNVASTTTVKAIGTAPAMTNSTQLTSVYTINPPAAPVVSPAGAFFSWNR